MLSAATERLALGITQPGARLEELRKKSRRRSKNHNERSDYCSKYFVRSDRFFGAVEQWQSVRKELEIPESSHSSRGCTLANTHFSTSRRSHLQRGVKTTSWEARKERDTKAVAIKALQKELKNEKAAELQRHRDAIKERREKAEEMKRLEEMKAKMSAKKLARVRKRQGRSKKVNH